MYKRLRTQLGYSLTELIVALGVVSVVLAGIVNLLVTLSLESKAASALAAFDEEVMRIQYFFTLQLRSAVNLRSLGNATINGYTIPSSGTSAFEGRLREFDSRDLANSNSIVNAVALFSRENGSITTTGGQNFSRFEQYGIYFQQPSASTYGMIYINQSNGGTIAPSSNGITTTNVVRLRVNNVVKDSNNYVQSFTVTVWMRFGTSSHIRNISWCPLNDDGSNPCGAGDPAADVFRSFTINLQNNMNPTSGSSMTMMGRNYLLGRGTL